MSLFPDLSKTPHENTSDLPNQFFRQEKIKTYSYRWGLFLVSLNRELAFRIDNPIFKKSWLNRKSTINYINDHLRDFYLLEPLDRGTSVDRVKQVYNSRKLIEYDSCNSSYIKETASYSYSSSCLDDTPSEQS